jgi:hypothetical protein
VRRSILFLLFAASCGNVDNKLVVDNANPVTAAPAPATESSSSAGPHWKELCPEPGESNETSPLRFSIEYRSREVSKDSNSSRLSADFDGRVLTMTGPYGKCVRGRCKHKEVKLVPTAEEIAVIQDQLNGAKLWASVVEVSDTEFSGPHHTTSMTLKMSNGQRSVSTNVKYGRGFKKQRERMSTGSDEARAQAESARRFLKRLRTTALRCFPDFHTN